MGVLEVSRVAGMLTADSSGMRHLLAPTLFPSAPQKQLFGEGLLGRTPEVSRHLCLSLDGLRQASLASAPRSLKWGRIRTPLGACPGPPVGGAGGHESDLGWVRGHWVWRSGRMFCICGPIIIAWDGDGESNE